VKGVTKLLAKVNLALNEQILSALGTGESRSSFFEDLPRTRALLEGGAKSGHHWIVMDGHSLAATFPVHAPEWEALRAEFLKNMCEEFAKHAGDAAESKKDYDPSFAVQFLTAISEERADRP
jgi:hypothetical protein